LPSTVVTATRVEDPVSEVPYSVSAVGKLDFERMMPRTTPEALRELPSVMLQKSAHGQGSPYIRGFTGFRTLMLVDGIRLNNSTFRDGPNQYWNTVDALSLQQLEVVRGPSSVLYGSDAIGGTVNALSKSRRDFGKGFDWDGGTYYRYASGEDSHMGRAEFSASVQDDFGVHVGGSIKDFGDLRGGDAVGLQPQTGYSEWDLDFKLSYRVTDHSHLVYAHQSVRLDDAWRTHSTIYGIPWEGTSQGSDLKRAFDQGRDLDYLQYQVENLEAFVEDMHFSLSRHHQDEAEDRIRSNSTRQIQTVDVETLGLCAQLESPSPVGRWVYGAEYYRDWVNSSYRGYDARGNLTSVRVQGPVADDATYDLVGVFAEDQIPLFAERLHLYIGGRYNYAAVDANKIRDPSTGATFSLADSWQTLVGSGRALYHVDAEQHLALFAGASQGYRAPNLSDLTRWDADWGQEIPSPGVQPEHFLSLEAGGRLNFERFQFEAVYFHTLIDEMIVRVPTGEYAGTVPIVTKENSGEGYVHGIELTGGVRLHPDVTLWANFTWMRGELETPTLGGRTVTEPVSRLMPATVNSGLRWRHPKGRVWAEFASTFAERQDRLASNDLLDTQRIPPGGTPGYGVYHLRAGWNPCNFATLSAALENLTDEDYRIHGSGINEPGRNFVITAEFRF
jgi:hemoglobin/transferrin/lactoferrin receptor protein